MNKQIKYVEIKNLKTLVSLLGRDDVIFYYKKGYDNYVPRTAKQIVDSEHKHMVYLIRQSQLFYSQL